MNTKISDAVEAAMSAFNGYEGMLSVRMRAALEAALPHLAADAVPVAFCRDGVLFWHGDHAAHCGENYDLFAHPQPADLNDGGGDERPRFEAYRGGDLERDAQGYYMSARTARDWAMWQAALSVRPPVGVDLRGQVRNLIQHAEASPDSLAALIGLGVIADPDVTRLAALLVHQPVGREPVGYTRAEAWCDPMPTISVEEYLGLRKQGMGDSFRPYYFAPPAQAAGDEERAEMFRKGWEAGSTAQGIDLGQVREIRIPARNKLDPISVFVQDQAPGRGRIVVTCYGNAWQGFWGAMGDRTVMEFVAQCDAQYVAGSMLQGRQMRVAKNERDYAERIAAEVISEFRALMDSQRDAGAGVDK